MEIKNYLFKNLYNNKKDIISKKVIKKNKKDIIKKGSIFNKKQESSNSIYSHQNIIKNNLFVNTKTNSSNNIINNSSIFNSYYQSQSSDKKSIPKKSGKKLNSRNLSQANKISLNNKKKFLTSSNNTTATSIINNQINNYNKCITDRNNEENKIKSINVNKINNGSQFVGKSKTLINKDIKENNYLSTVVAKPKKVFGATKKDSNSNISKNMIKMKLQNKDIKYQLNYNDNNNTNNIMNENILFKKKIKNFKNSNSKIQKLNSNKLKNTNINHNLNDYKNKTINLLNIKKLNLSNLPINFLDGKLIQGIMNLNNNNNNINSETITKKESNTDRPNYNYNYNNNVNTQNKNKEMINEQYNNINNNYIIANIVNNIKLNNKKAKNKNMSRNKSIKLSEKKNTIYNSNLTSLNILLKNTNSKNYPSSFRIKTIDINKTNNKSPSIDYNASFNKKPIFDNKNINRRLFDGSSLNIHFHKRNTSSKRKNYCHLKFKKKGKNYKKVANVPLKLTKKNVIQKEKKLNLDMNFSNNNLGFDKLNLLTFNYIHSINFSHKHEKTIHNRRKLSQGNNNSDKYKNIFQLFINNRGSNDSKRDTNFINHRMDSMSNIIKSNLMNNIPKHSNKINSFSNYNINKEKDIIKNSNTITLKDNKNILFQSRKIYSKKPHSNSPFNINCLLKRKNFKKNNEINIYSKSRTISRNYKNYIGCFNNETKTNLSKYKTNKSSKSKKGKNEKNIQNENNNININSKKKIKNLSVAIYTINKSTKNNLDNVNSGNEKLKQYSLNNIFNKKNNNEQKNSENKKSKEKKVISIKIISKNSSHQNIQDISSNKNKNQSETSKRSRNINIPIDNHKIKTVVKEKVNPENHLEENENENTKYPMIIDEYFDEILYSLLKEESDFISKKIINHSYLFDETNEISPEMRAMVVDWLLEVHQIFHFQEKCLFTTVQIIDKYLSKKNISIEQFQLLSLTALNIASKQEEVEYPILDNFITISKNTITKKEMIDMENNVISTIDFEILSPTILDFFQLYAAVCNLNPVEISQGLYIMNIILIDINMLKHKNSILAFVVLKLITKEEKVKELIIFIKEICKKAYKVNGNKNNEAQILLNEINKENNSHHLKKEVKNLFRTILKTHYLNAKNKFNSQNFYAVSSYTSI